MCLGIPGQIIEITDHTRDLAIVEVSGVRREINVTCVLAEDAPHQTLLGAWVLIHAGFAMSIIDEKEAEETLKTLMMLGEAVDQLAASHSADSLTGKD